MLSGLVLQSSLQLFLLVTYVHCLPCLHIEKLLGCLILPHLFSLASITHDSIIASMEMVGELASSITSSPLLPNALRLSFTFSCVFIMCVCVFGRVIVCSFTCTSANCSLLVLVVDYIAHLF